MKQITKRIIALMLSLMLVLQVFPLSIFHVEAADITMPASQTYENKKTGVTYVYFNDISNYRDGREFTHPEKEGYVFGGWWTGITEAADDSVATPVSENTRVGAAWAKFVPENVLTVKAQISKRVAEVTDTSEKVKLRLVTSVDSLRYSEVGFRVFVTKETTLKTTDAYSKVSIRENAQTTSTVEPKEVFDKNASAYFATRVVGGFTMDTFTSKELNVTPYWETLDGTIVEGTTRNRLLVSDDRANDADGSGNDFTVSDNTYIYKKEAVADNKASYQYFKGASDTIYLKGTYTSVGTNNKFGVSIRNGGVTRNVFFEGYGARVYDGADTNMFNSEGVKVYTWAQTNVNGAYVWQQGLNGNNETNSLVAKMLATEGTYDIIWAIDDNKLYCSMGSENASSKALFMIPMTELCTDWQDDRYYQLGVAGYNSAATISNMKFVVDTIEFGETVYSQNLLTKEPEQVQVSDVTYVPISASYVPSSEYQPYISRLYSKTISTPFAKADTPVGIKGTAEQCHDDWTSYVGVTVTLKKEDGTTQSVEYFPAPNSGSFASANLNGNNSSNWTDFNTPAVRTVNNGSNDIKVAVYDDKLSVLFNDVTEYEIALGDLFSKFELQYTGTEQVSVGLAICYDRSDIVVDQLPFFKDVVTYEGQEAIDMKMADWTFYPESANEYITYNVAIGEIDDANDNYGHLVLQGTSDVWEVSGTLSHDADNDAWAYHGFGIVSGDAGLRLWGKETGFFYDYLTTGGSADGVGWFNWQGTNEYVFQTEAGNSFFNAKEAAGPITFKAVVAHDTFFFWLDDVLTWMIPLSEMNSSLVGPNYQFAFTGNWADARWNDVSVKTGSEVDAEFVTTLKTALDMNWLSANSLRTLNSEGSITVLNTDGGDIASCVYSNKASNAIYMSGTWTKEFDVADYFGIVLSDGTNVRQVNLHEQGFMMMAGDTWSGDESWMWKYNFLGTDGVVWGQLDASKNKTSAIEKMLTGSEKSHKIEWAIYQNDLYCSVDGQISFIVPLEEICHEWTDEAAKQLYVGVSDYQPAQGKYTNVSNLQIFYDTEAIQKLSAGVSEEFVDVNNIIYDAINGAYIAKYMEGSAAAYGEQGETVGIQAKIAWYDMESADGVAGISVKASNGKTIEIMSFDRTPKLRKLENLTWDEQWEDIEISNDIFPFNKEGICDVNAYVYDEHLYISFNGMKAYDIALSEYIDEYEEGLTYQIGVATNNSDEGVAYFRDIKFLTAEEIIAAGRIIDIDETSSETAYMNEMTGTVTRTGDNAEVVLVNDTSDTWELTGIMKKGSDCTGVVPHGFAVKDASSGDLWRFYGQDNNVTVASWSSWGTYNDSKYVYNESAWQYFGVEGQKEQAHFRLVIKEDTLYLWLDDVLTWRIPLTASQFGAFESGSVYQIGVAVNGGTAEDAADDGTITYQGMTAKCGKDVNTLNTTKFVVANSTDGVVTNSENGKVIVNGSNNVDTIYFATDEANNRSSKWEVSGTIRRADMNVGSMIGFKISDGEHEAGYWFANSEGMMVGVGYPWNYYGTDTDGICYNAAASNFGQRMNEQDEIAFRAVILEDVFYVYFEGQLTWKLNLTSDSFGYTDSVSDDWSSQTLKGFAAGSTYSFGFTNVDAATIYYENLTVKSGNAVLTQEDFFIRDPYVLADNGVYYMYGTRYDGSFDVFTSTDLMVWEKQGQCFVPEGDFWGGTTNFWAPEVYKYTYNGETAYYMFATFLSNETIAKDESLNMSYDNEGVRGTAVLKAESPLGPFKEYSDGALTLEAHDCLDGTLYVDEDGTPYMIYAHEHTCGACHNGNVRVGEMNYVQLSEDLKTTIGEHKEWFSAADYKGDYKWNGETLKDGGTFLTDGPFVYNIGTQKYLLWTTSELNKDGSYIQLAISFSTIGDVTGAGVETNSSVLYGSDTPGGHAMIFTGFDEQTYMILHTPNSGDVKSKLFVITIQDGTWIVEEKMN